MCVSLLIEIKIAPPKSTFHSVNTPCHHSGAGNDLSLTEKVGPLQLQVCFSTLGMEEQGPKT